MASKCKLYSEITVESGTQLKIVYICSAIEIEKHLQYRKCAKPFLFEVLSNIATLTSFQSLKIDLSKSRHLFLDTLWTVHCTLRTLLLQGVLKV